MSSNNSAEWTSLKSKKKWTKTEPCGTPHDVVNAVEKQLVSFTLYQ